MILFCGEFDQSDLQRTNEKNGLHNFLRILEQMEEFNCTEFTRKKLFVLVLLETISLIKLN